MLRNYFKTAFRSFQRNKAHSLINVASLSFGMTIAMLIGLWIWDEVFFDKSFENHGRIAQVMQNANFDGNVSTATVTPIPLGTKLRQDYKSDFKYTVLSTFTEKHILVHGKEKLNCKGNYMQTEAPEMLTLHMLKGSRSGLNDPSSILLSASLAQSLFGDLDPMNKLIKIDNKFNVKVTGVYQDLPNNTSFKEVAFIAPWDLYMTTLRKDAATFWMNNSWQIFVQLSPHADINQVSGRIKNLVMENLPAPPGQSGSSFTVALFLHPMDKWHLYSEFKNGVNTGGRIEFVWMFGIIGLFILLLACINFMNLSTAKSEKRAKEVGIRKTLGSHRKELVTQFFGESLLVTFFAFMITLELVQLCLPFFNGLANKNMSIPWYNPIFWLTGIGFCLITGVIAGSYPAFYLSSFEPVKVLKGTFRVGRFAALPRKVLIVLQFSVSVILIIGTVIVFRQIQFTKDRPVGYSPNGLLQLEMKTPAIHQHFNAVRNDLLASGAIADMAESGSPLTDIRANYGGLDWPGKDPTMHDDFGYVPVSSTFGKTAGWKIKGGRDFLGDFPGDSTGMILNEAAVTYMGLKHPVGEIISWGKKYKVIGVVRNLVMTSPYDPVKPTLFCRLNRAGEMINIRINPGMSTSKAIAKISAIFKQYDPESPFDYQFTDTEYAKKFGDEERIGKLAGVFSAFAIFICCIGLFGMASFMAEQRIKEIAVRKVLGASVFGLWALMSKEFVTLVLIALSIAIPTGYYFMHDWLQNYNYHTELSWWIFAMAAIGAILITLLTVSYQSIKASLINPVKSLRAE
jgi:putative ABC transport system permease protein